MWFNGLLYKYLFAGRKKEDKTMNYTALDNLIKKHEGERLTVYPDSLGNPTVGIGHKVLPADNLRVGDTITPERSKALYIQDRTIAVDAAKRLFLKFDTFPDSAQQAIVDMIFNMGEGTVKGMTNTRALIEKQDWNAVSAYMESPAFDKWRSQVGKRADSVVSLFKTAAAGGIVIILLIGAVLWYILSRGKVV